MSLFRKAKKSDCWLSTDLRRDGVALAIVSRASGERPVLERAIHLPGNGNAEPLAQSARDVRAQDYRCTTLLGPGQYQLLSIDAINVPAAELKTAVRWRLKDLLDFPANEATIDVLHIPVDATAGARAQNTMFVVAARNSVVAERQTVFATAKYDLSVIDIPELAQRNVAALLEPEGRGLAMLSFDEDGALLTVSYRGELYLARRIEMPLAHLTDPDTDRRNQSFDRITLELQRSLDNLERQYSFISVAKLVLGPSTIAGLDEYLSSNLYAPVDSLDLSAVLDLSKVPELVDRAVQQRFFMAIGAALRVEDNAR